MTKKLDYLIRMYDASENQCDYKIQARSADQAFKLTMSDPQNERYVSFGLVGADRNCHSWRYRDGVPRHRPGGHGTLASTLQHARGVTATARKKAPEPPSEQNGPAVISVAEMFDVVKKRALPQMSPDPFEVRDITKYIPEPYRQNWLPKVWPAVMNKLRAEGVLLKKGHFLYARNPEFISMKLIEDEAAPVANGNGHAHTNGADVIASPPVVTPSVAPAEVTAPLLSPEQKIDAAVMLLMHLATDDQKKKAEIHAIADRLVDVAATLDTIRSDMERVLKGEEAVPRRMSDMLLMALKQPAPQQTALAA